MALPRSIAGYDIEDRLGQGGMGTVYLARDTELGRRVAIKLIQAEFDSAETRDRFLKEARSIAALSHPNIVTLYHSGTFESRPYLVLEYIEGRSVESIIRNREPVPFAARLQWLEELCDGLQFAHSRGVIHRDIKPANLMVDHLDRLRILDFGIARIVGADRTQFSGVVGTPAYMAPEYLRGEEADHRVDVFAAGAVAYELFAHRPAFTGRTHATITYNVLEYSPPRFAEIGAGGVPTDLEQVILSALWKEPNERFQTAREFGDAIRAVRLRSNLDAPAPTVVDGTRTLLRAGHVSDAPVAVAEVMSAAANGMENSGETIEAPRRSAPSRRSLRDAAIGIGALAALAAVVLMVLRLVDPAPPVASPESSEKVAPSVGSNDLPAPPVGSSDPPATTGPTVAPTDSQSTAAPPSASNVPATLTATVSPTVTEPRAEPPAPDESIPRVEVPLGAKDLFSHSGSSGTAGPTNPGLLYRVLRLTEGGDPVGIDPDTTTLRTGKDAVRFVFQPNVDGYLYVAQEATNGVWDVLFPHPEINGGRNDVVSFETYVIPTGRDSFKLSPPSGTDKVFVYLSKTRVGGLPELNRPVTKPETLELASIARFTETISKRVLVFEKASVPRLPRKRVARAFTW